MTRGKSAPIRGHSAAAALVARVALGGLAALALAAQSHAEIANRATASGTYDGQAVTSNVSSASVPVAPPNPALTVSVNSTRFDPNLTGDAGLEAGDTLVFAVNVRNDGNVSLTDVAARVGSISFNGQPHDPERLAVSAGEPAALAPGEDRDFTFTYTLAASDIYSAAGVVDGVTSTFDATAGAGQRQVAVTAGTSTATIAADPELTIAKSFQITTDNGAPGAADTGDVITYTYVVTNSGNVPLTDIRVSDAHESGEAHGAVFDSAAYSGELGSGPGQWSLTETTPAVFGANADPEAGDARYGTLGVGGVVTFTYVHQVTQAEFDAQ